MRKDLSMSAGKVAAMAAHASMMFLVKRVTKPYILLAQGRRQSMGVFTPDEWRWLTEPAPGLEEFNQVSFAKIVVAVDSEQELQEVYNAAHLKSLEVHRVFDSGYSHNPAGTFVCIAIGPAWLDAFDGVTNHLKIYK